MNQSSDAAEQIVRMSLQGFEVGARITGSGAKEVAALLLAVMKDKKKTAPFYRRRNFERLLLLPIT